ncbi:zinc ribbon domain-containing protein [Streptomyces sp. NPDC001970]
MRAEGLQHGARRPYGGVGVDRLFPSSKLCSHCGTLAEAMTLNVRTCTCDSCGTTHDRDVNSANNLLAAGPAVTVCGAGVDLNGELRAGGRRRSRKPHSASRENPPHQRGGEVKLGVAQRGQNRWEDHARRAAAGTPRAHSGSGPTSRGRPTRVERSRAGGSAGRGAAVP